MIFVMFLMLLNRGPDVQSGASYLWQGFVMFFLVSCECLPGQ